MVTDREQGGVLVRTGPNADGYVLESIVVRGHWSAGSIGAWVFELREDSWNPADGQHLATFSTTNPPPHNLNNQNFNWTAPHGVHLSPSTWYWIRSTVPAGDAEYTWKMQGFDMNDYTASDGWRFAGQYPTALDKRLSLRVLAWPVGPSAQYAQDFSSATVGATDFGDGSELLSNHGSNNVSVVDATYKELRLTAAGTSPTRTGFRLPDLDPGVPVRAFSAKWNMRISGNFPNAADGFSFNYGPLAALNLQSSEFTQEDGYGVGLSLGVRTFAGNDPGFYIRVNGAVVASIPHDPGTQWGTNNPVQHFFEMDWHHIHGVSVRLNGETLFAHVPTHGFVPQPNDRFVWAARTGGLNQDVRLDNIVVVTGGLLEEIQVNPPLYHLTNDVSPEAAFDGDVDTMWETFAPTGMIGGTLAAHHHVRAYALTSGGEDRTQDPGAWLLQGSTNAGANWATLASGEGSFATQRQTRAWMAGNNASFNSVRLNVTTNHGHTGATGLSGLTLYRFIPFSDPGPGIAFPSDAVVASSGNSPVGQGVDRAVDGSAATKYLNFDKFDTGLTVTPSYSNLVVHALGLISAEDAPERDPASYIVYGSTNGVDFVMITSNSVPPFPARQSLQVLPFPNTNAWPVYRVVFPTVRDPDTANSMQIAQVELLSYGNITTPEDDISLTLGDGANLTGDSSPGGLVDLRLHEADNKVVVMNTAGESTTVDITPAVGSSIARAIQIIGSSDDLAFQGRFPADFELLGSGDGINYTSLVSSPLIWPRNNLQLQGFALLENTNVFTHYRIILGPPHLGDTLQLSQIRLFGLFFPKLDIGRNPSDLVVSWPTMAGSFWLQRSGSLTSGDWSFVTNNISTTNDQYRSLITPPADADYFRLMFP